MIQYLNVFFYDIYPYLCGTVFLLGSWLRKTYGQLLSREEEKKILGMRFSGWGKLSKIFLVCLVPLSG